VLGMEHPLHRLVAQGLLSQHIAGCVCCAGLLVLTPRWLR
jgi:hypothetical protein